MSPYLGQEARAAGPRMTDTVRREGRKQWRCTICGASGSEYGGRAARLAYQRHYDRLHYESEAGQ